MILSAQFWDMRARGLRLDSALSEQAKVPPLDPAEKGLIDPACMVYRMSQRPYRSIAEKPWSAQAFAFQWPAGAKEVCDRPGPPRVADHFPLHLTTVERGTA